MSQAYRAMVKRKTEKVRLPRARKDLIVVSITTLLALPAAIIFDLSEKLSLLLQRYEWLEVDEFLFTFIILGVGFIFFSLRRTGDLRNAVVASRQAREEALSAHVKLSHLLTESPAVIYTCSVEEPYPATFVSYNVKALTGYGPEDFLKEPGFWAGKVHPDDAPRILGELPGLFERGELVHEYRWRKKDGAYMWVYDQIRLSYDAGGNPVEIVGTWLDITTRRAAEEALKITQFSVDSASDPVFWLGPDAGFLYVNDSACRKLGYSREEMLSMTVHEIDPNFPKDAWQGHWRELKLRGSLTFESKHRAKDGAVFPVEITANYIEFGGKEYNCAYVHDITKRKRAEEEIRESRRSIETLMSNLPGMAYRCLNDSAWTMQFISEGCGELTGYEHGELVGNSRVSYNDIIHTDDRKSVWENVQAALNDKMPFKLVYRIVKKSGETRWVWEKGRGILSEYGELRFLEGFITDITERKLAEEKVMRQVRRLAALRRIDRAITSSLDLRITLDIFISEVLAQLNVDAASVLLLNPHTLMLEYAAAKGYRGEDIKRSALRLGECYSGRVALERKPVVLSDVAEASAGFTRAFLVKDEEFKAYIGQPLIVKGQVKGVLEIFHRTHMEPDKEWTEFLEALSGQAAIAIDNASMFNDLQRSHNELILAYDTTIVGWAKALDYRDRETEGHSQRVTEMTLRIAREMGMSEEDLVHARRGALLHDIGKLGVPDEILFKPGKLNDEEWVVMKRHAILAYELLSPIAFLRPALDIPYCHHEKWDGTGYPRGLEGEQIPLSARIFAVVDVWDALSSDRPYRPAWPREKVEEYLRSNSGSHFDQEVVETFLSIEW